VVRYLLDANILSDLVRRPEGVVAARIEREGLDAVCTSIIVAAELRFGAVRKGSPRLSALIEGLLARITVLAFESPADRVYAELRAHLAAAGLPIGANDLLIAAHALTLGCTLVTANMREFERIETLKLENWLADS
jgi:tRNA(fMet)-specific endonuclease VapC